MKKFHHGFTLVEMIVALAVFAVMTLVIATVFSSTAKMQMKTNQMNLKINNQVINATIGSSTSSDKITTGSSVKIKFDLSGITHEKEIKIVEIDKNDLSKQESSKTNIKYFVSMP